MFLLCFWSNNTVYYINSEDLATSKLVLGHTHTPTKACGEFIWPVRSVFQTFLTWTNLLYLSPVKPHNNATQKVWSCPSHVNNDSHRSPSFLTNWLGRPLFHDHPTCLTLPQHTCTSAYFSKHLSHLSQAFGINHVHTSYLHHIFSRIVRYKHSFGGESGYFVCASFICQNACKDAVQQLQFV